MILGLSSSDIPDGQSFLVIKLLGHHMDTRNHCPERHIYLYFSVVTGMHYGTKTPPGQQPMKLSAGDMMRGDYLHGLQVWSFKVCSLVLCGKVNLGVL